MTKANRFGARFRVLRKEAGLRLGELATKLGVSTTYLSDVELGKRSPFGDKILRKAARALSCDLDSLRIEAAQSRGAFELSPKTLRHREVGAALMRTWEHLDDEQLAELANLATKWQERLDDDDA